MPNYNSFAVYICLPLLLRDNGLGLRLNDDLDKNISQVGQYLMCIFDQDHLETFRDSLYL